jgi:predicted glycosyltransferase involved in capsule biosynthesis
MFIAVIHVICRHYYRLAYQELVGGVLNMRTEHFQKVNGYSNLYWGWGAEDDDMAYRYV